MSDATDARDADTETGLEIHDADITALILDDHDSFRRSFAALDALQAPDIDSADLPAKLAAIWDPLADLLDVHAVAEERIFYPELLRKGDKGDQGDQGDAVDETLDAVGDHNDIRDAAHAAAQHPPGSPEWWDAVNRTREANTHHMGEEEDEAMPDFRRNVPQARRVALGRQFAEFKATHTARDLDTSDQDPERFVAEHLPEGSDAAGSGGGSR